MGSKLLIVSGILLFSPVYAAFASSFTDLTVFGDSLSDNGNAYIGTLGLKPGPNYGSYTIPGTTTTVSYFSDGSNTTPAAAGVPGVWVDKLAGKLGVADPTPFLAGAANASNYATGGAETGSSGVQDVGNQIAAFTLGHPGGASSTGLYAFWAGANDILDGSSPVTAADNIQGYISALHGEGATHFLWLNLPLLGDTPGGQIDKSALNAASLAFNGEWAKDLAALQASGIAVDGVNIESLFTNLIGNPGAYGLSDVTHPAQGLSTPTDAGYLFWDELHPTAAVHTLVADTVYSSLTATPEPASIGFAAFGVLALAGLGLKRRLNRAH